MQRAVRRGRYDARVEQHLCTCGMPLLARYDLDAARAWKKESLAAREPNMWRYRELMPLFDGEQPLTLGEGWTPLIHAQAARRRPRPVAPVRQGRIAQSDQLVQGARPRRRRSRKASLLGAKTLSVPSAGNAANAMAAYAAAAGITAKVFMPKDVKVPFIRECELYGADVTLVDGLITDAGRIAAETGKPLGWYDVSTLKEPYRIEGKKTMAYELGEQLDWQFPDWIIYPTGGGTGMVGMWKAFEEMEAIGWKAAGTAAEDGLGAGRALRADRARLRAGRRALGDVPQRAHRGRRPARAQGDRRFPGAARGPRERRHRPRRLRRRHGPRHARAGRAGRHQRRARRRRRAARAQGTC